MRDLNRIFGDVRLFTLKPIVREFRSRESSVEFRGSSSRAEGDGLWSIKIHVKSTYWKNCCDINKLTVHIYYVYELKSLYDLMNF